MTITILVPDWNANDQLHEFAKKRHGLEGYVGYLHGHDLQFSPSSSCDVFTFKSRLEDVPAQLADLPLASVRIIKHNSPVTNAPDGFYYEGLVTARVETYIKDGMRLQTITVNGPSLQVVNDWFDELLNGDKNDKCVRPISYPEVNDHDTIEQPVSTTK